MHGIQWHLGQALEQANNTNTPTVISFVVYDLPDRDCAAYSSNGEIQDNGIAANVPGNLNEYYHNYIDPFNNAISDFYQANPTALGKVKIVLLVEPDALPNMITNGGIHNGSTQFPVCEFANQYKVYTQGIEYALNAFTTSDYASSMTLYLDIGHEGWLGWANNANQISQIYNDQESTNTNTWYGGLGKGFDKVRGFVVNTANASPLTEVFSYSQYLLNNTIISSDYYQWNDVYSLDSYMAELISLDSNGQLDEINGHQILAPSSNALYGNMHFIVDTSRNNWPVTLNYGSYSRSDIRDATGNWCNVQNIVINGTHYSPGLGILPEADPKLPNPLYGTNNLPVDAYLWVKPAGTSEMVITTLQQVVGIKCVELGMEASIMVANLQTHYKKQMDHRHLQLGIGSKKHSSYY